MTDVRSRYRRGGGVYGITIKAQTGERLVLFGGAGSGKTTILRLLAGRLSPESGVVRILGKSARGATRSIGYASEDTPLPSRLTLHQTLQHAMARHNVPAASRPARMASIMEQCGLFEERDRPIRDLSHGTRTLLALAMALIHRPAVLLLDNLFGTLSMPVSERLGAHLEERRVSDGLTIIEATTVSERAEQADYVLLLDAGRQRACAPPAELLAEHATDTLIVEATSPDEVQRTLRGIFDVEIEEKRSQIRFSTRDGIATAAHLLRHPTGGVRTVYLRHPSLWDVLDKLRD